jgi:hypothetical protein
VRHFEFKATLLLNLFSFQASKSFSGSIPFQDVHKKDDKVKVTRTHCTGEKFQDLHLAVPFVDVMSDDNDFRPPKVTLKVVVRINPALRDECSNLTRIKIEVLEDLQRQSKWYHVDTH